MFGTKSLKKKQPKKAPANFFPAQFSIEVMPISDVKGRMMGLDGDTSLLVFGLFIQSIVIPKIETPKRGRF